MQGEEGQEDGRDAVREGAEVVAKKRKENVYWCNRDVTPTPYYALCTSKKNFARECKRLGAKRYGLRWITKGANATTHFLDKSNGGSGVKDACIICIDPREAVKRPPVEIIGLLVHEGVHVWQEQLRTMREDKPSSEFEAYAVQSIAQNLYHAYDELTKAKKPNKKRAA
jgi:hypothetical protein